MHLAATGRGHPPAYPPVARRERARDDKRDRITRLIATHKKDIVKSKGELNKRVKSFIEFWRGLNTTWRVTAYEGEREEDREKRSDLSRVTPFRPLERSLAVAS